MLEIDGSMGEGGGQILRTALTLSILTGVPFILKNIRAGRKQPGLKSQHLKSVDAAAAISRARVVGARLGATWLSFVPGNIRSGHYRFDIGTAGSTSLVLQTIFLPLTRAGSASSLVITGGTHVPWSPTFDYLNLLWKPMLTRLGYDFALNLEKAGFYPAGGGRIQASIRPAAETTPLLLLEPGKLVQINGISATANLDINIGHRQKYQALKRLENLGVPVKICTAELASDHKGTALTLQANFTTGTEQNHTACCYTALGELGKPAERVADEAIDALLGFLETKMAVDEHLADQLLLPLAFAGQESIYTTCSVTQHLRTCAEIIRKFLEVTIEIDGSLGSPGKVRILPPGI